MSVTNVAKRRGQMLDEIMAFHREQLPKTMRELSLENVRAMANVAPTPADFYAALHVLPQRERQGLIEAIRRDLARFIGVDLVETLEQNDFADLIAAVQQTFQEIVASKQVHLEAYGKKA